MILQALTAYYEQLLQKGAISAPGWDHAFNVSFYLVIDDAGRLLHTEDKHISVQKGKKQVLAPIQRSGPCKALLRHCGKFSVRQLHLSAGS